MEKQDKIIAIAGVTLIIILAIVAVILLANDNTYNRGMVNVAPKTETVDIKEDNTNIIVESDEGISSDVTENMVESTTVNVNKNEKNGQQLPEKYSKSTIKKVITGDSQLAELAGYWEEYKMDAVGDLIRLERIRAYTNDLKDSKQFYYYGETDETKSPNGRGLAIYADNTYYYGDWKKGLRDGNGMWLRIYPDEPGVEGKYTDILEHQYNGEFKNDLPNGEGQEHYTYGNEEFDYYNSEIIMNVIGNFKNGYYDGDIYLMTRVHGKAYYDWHATAKSGVFQVCLNNVVSSNNKKPVWIEGGENNGDNDGDDGYYWMSEEHNKNFGIYGLKK